MREGAKFYVMRWRTAVVLILSQIVNSASPALSPGNSPEDGPDGPNVHIWTSCDEGNADNPEVSHLETDDNLPGREHGLG